ncbi:MAG: tetratricopeptide repeat protein, partial [Flavobacteriales bacterium]|nr:tetratricopeptide repeat protein [Flavobacteriales bacterium]
LNQNDKAIEAFLSIEKEKATTTDLIAQGKSRAAAAYYNRGDSKRSLALYKEIVEKYPSSPVMPQSMRWARQISVERGESDSFIKWSGEVNSTPIDMLSMDSLQWETAHKFYVQKDYPMAITHLDRYTAQYPTGLFLPDVIYARGESYMGIGDTTAAKKDYLALSTQKGGKYTENALLKYTDIMIKQDSAYYALPQIEGLYNVASHEENKKYAAINALGIYYDEQDWEGVKRYADIIRSQYKSDARLYADASVALYATLVEEGEYKQASQLTEDVMRVAVDENMARSLYYRARIEYEDKNYEASIKTITYLCSQYPMYKYIGARALILLAQNYYATGDTYQAGYILENVMSSTTYTDIRNEASLINEYIKSKNTDK